MVAPSPLSDLTSLSAGELRALVTDLVTQLQAVETQSEHIVTETLRLQRFVRALRLESTDASEAALES